MESSYFRLYEVSSGNGQSSDRWGPEGMRQGKKKKEIKMAGGASKQAQDEDRTGMRRGGGRDGKMLNFMK